MIEQNKYGYIYLVVDALNKHNLSNPYYVGKRKSNEFQSNYWGSGILIKQAIAKAEGKVSGK